MVSGVILSGSVALALYAKPRNFLSDFSGISEGNLAPRAVPFSNVSLGTLPLLYDPQFASNFTVMVSDAPSFHIAYNVSDSVNTVSFVTSGIVDALS